jgi:hypothetical protein
MLNGESEAVQPKIKKAETAATKKIGLRGKLLR